MNNEEKILDLLIKLSEDMTDVKSKVGGIETRLDKLENQVTVMENDLGNKINALFDGYLSNTESVNRLADTVHRMDSQMEKHETELIAFRFNNQQNKQH